MFTLLSSGSNAQGQLSNGSAEDSYEFQPCFFSNCAPNTLPVDTHQVLDIASGANHTIVLLEIRKQFGSPETQLWGSGDGSAGQLGAAYRQSIQSGAESTIFRPIELPLEQEGLPGYQPKLVSATWKTTYIALSLEGRSDVLISMGSNDFGDLGVGMIGDEKTKPFYIVSFDHLALDGIPLKNANITILSLVTGQRHVVVQLEVGNSLRKCIAGWGTSRHGQLGDVLDGRGHPISFISMPRIISVEDDRDPIVATALGSQHTVLLRASGGILGLGSNRKGQLQGLGDAKHATKIDCTWNGTYVVTEGDDGVEHILVTGSGAHGQLGRQISSGLITSLAPVELPLSKVTKIRGLACGTEHVLVLLSRSSEAGDSSEVWGWGWNEHGNLGVGTTENIFTPIQLWPPKLGQQGGRNPFAFAIGIWGGPGTSWIVASTGNTG